MKKLLFTLVLGIGVISLSIASIDTMVVSQSAEMSIHDPEPCKVHGKKKVKVLGIRVGTTTVECEASNCDLAEKCLDGMLDQ